MTIFRKKMISFFGLITHPTGSGSFFSYRTIFIFNKIYLFKKIKKSKEMIAFKSNLGFLNYDLKFLNR